MTDRSGTRPSAAVGREHESGEMGRDLVRAAQTSPMVSLLVMGAVVVGGSMLIAAMLKDDGPAGAGESRGLLRLGSASNGLGPKGIETLTRIRDAVFSFVFDKAVATADQMFPGFREHYERG
jgi:hypothetical protein